MKQAMISSTILLLLAALSFVSGSAFATPAAQASFSGACAEASFAASGSDIEYFDLNLDLEHGGSKECVITTTIPGTPGLTINVSTFKAEAFAEVEAGGIATLLVNHRFNGQTELASRTIARESGDLVSEQLAVGRSNCGASVELRTKLAVKAVKAILLQDSATANTVSYKIDFTPSQE